MRLRVSHYCRLNSESRMIFDHDLIMRYHFFRFHAIILVSFAFNATEVTCEVSFSSAVGRLCATPELLSVLVLSRFLTYVQVFRVR